MAMVPSIEELVTRWAKVENIPVAFSAVGGTVVGFWGGDFIGEFAKAAANVTGRTGLAVEGATKFGLGTVLTFVGAKARGLLRLGLFSVAFGLGASILYDIVTYLVPVEELGRAQGLKFRAWFLAATAATPGASAPELVRRPTASEPVLPLTR